MKSKNNFSYSFQSKTKFPLFGFNHSLLCDVIPRHNIPQPRFQLQRWFEAIDRILLPQKADIAPLSNVIKAHEILWKLRPIEEKPKHEYSAQLISHMRLDMANKTLTARIFGSFPVRIAITGESIAVNRKNNPNGINDIRIVKEDQKLLPADKTLGWAPIRITALFNKGILNGLTRIETNVSTIVWGIAINGTLHGPSITYKIPYIIEPVSKNK